MGVSHCESIPQIINFVFHDFSHELNLLSFSLCCFLLFSVVNLVFARKKKKCEAQLCVLPKSLSGNPNRNCCDC